MPKERSKAAIKLLNTGHFLLTVLSFYLVWMKTVAPSVGFAESRYNIYVTGLYALMVFILNRTYNSYLVGYMSVGDMIYSQCLSSTLTIFAVYFLTSLAWFRLYSPIPFLILLAAQIVWNILWSNLISWIYFKRIPPKETAVIYHSREDLLRVKEIEENPKQFRITAYIQESELEPGRLERLKQYRAIFVVGVEAAIRNSLAQFCVENAIQGCFLPDVGDVILAGAKHMQSYSIPLMNVERKSPDPEYLIFKRIFDIAASLMGLVIASPFMLLTALAIRLYDRGPALYTQVRLTKNGKKFKILKFRSMRVDAEEDGVARLTTANDNRITPVGRVIRAVRFDEMPQLINILKGDMSLVGPRPERPEIAKQYEEDFPAFNLRLQVKAGLTGYAQVYGRYNTDPHDKLQMDLMYINKMSLMTDAMLLFGTLRILFLRESTSGVEEGQVTASVSEKQKDSGL
ncbi:MAG: sugar transferase [Lachnospiraceae bacterium]|nr:sugar transferase [Lachnospiraceae bacterium]